MQESAPFLQAARAFAEQTNSFGSHTIGRKTFKAGDFVFGTWVSPTGQTYFQEGKVVEYPATGLWVQSQPDGGITQIKDFIFLNFDPSHDS